jgi:chromosome segregation ATPase
MSLASDAKDARARALAVAKMAFPLLRLRSNVKLVDSKVGELDARIDALAGRIDASLVRARKWIERPKPMLDGAVDAARDARIEAAEARARLQAQRCQALEDHVTELEAALVGAGEERARAVADAESARQQADRALDQLEANAHGDHDSDALDAKLNQALQAKLLEVERMSSELVSLRRSNEEWRDRARTTRRELDRATAELERTSPQLSELRERDEASRKRLAELERTVSEQRRELEIAERRAQHLREHMAVR